MNNILFLIFALSAAFICNSASSQSVLSFEVKCHDANYLIDTVKQPRFILAIGNKSMNPVKLTQRLRIGHSNTGRGNDISFELYQLKGGDTINILNKILSYSGEQLPRHKDKIKLLPFEQHLISFDFLSAKYLSEPGEYRIRFTLHRIYADEYLSNDIATEWITLNVHSVP